MTAYDKDSGTVFLNNKPYISELQLPDNCYIFTFEDGTEKHLDLDDLNYRIIRREE